MFWVSSLRPRESKTCSGKAVISRKVPGVKRETWSLAVQADLSVSRIFFLLCGFVRFGENEPKKKTSLTAGGDI